MKKSSFYVALFAAAALFTGVGANAQLYPNKPIRLIVPTPAGGSGDLVLRPLAEKLLPTLGQAILLDYKPGASQIIGTDLLAKAAPDGYTIGFITTSHSINPIFQKLPYNSLADFAPITQLVDVPLALVTHPSVPAKTIPELVAYAKSNPGKLAYGSFGFGGPHYIAMEWFKLLAGINLLHVPYQGSAPALTAAVGNHIQLMFVGPGIALQYAKEGRLNVIAASPARRLPAAPQLPAIAESGYKDFDITTFYGLLAPARTPREIVARLSQEFGRELRSSDLQERFGALGQAPAPSTPEEFAATLRQDAEYWARMVKLTGARGE